MVDPQALVGVGDLVLQRHLALGVLRLELPPAIPLLGLNQLVALRLGRFDRLRHLAAVLLRVPVLQQARLLQQPLALRLKLERRVPRLRGGELRELPLQSLPARGLELRLVEPLLRLLRLLRLLLCRGARGAARGVVQLRLRRRAVAGLHPIQRPLRQCHPRRQGLPLVQGRVRGIPRARGALGRGRRREGRVGPRRRGVGRPRHSERHRPHRYRGGPRHPWCWPRWVVWSEAPPQGGGGGERRATEGGGHAAGRGGVRVRNAH